jgi:hypothetical protein
MREKAISQARIGYSGEQGLGFDGWKRFHLFKRYCGGVNAGWRVSHRAIARPAMKTIVERKLI